MNVVIWARVSSREQREGYSIDAQLRFNRDRAERSGWRVVREFVVAESAKRGAERVAFNEMVKWVKANAKKEKIKSILSHKLDRVCRNMRDAVRLQELEDICGVQLAFVDNQFGPGAAGALSFNVMAAVAQYYSDNLRSEVLKGMDEKVRQGWPTGLAAYGYTSTDDRSEPVKPYPDKAKTLVRIFDLYACGGYTIESLADKLFEEGHVFRASQVRFNRTALSYILKNRFYIGELHRNGQMFEGKYRGLREHVYYRCANNKAGPDHPKVRWTSERLESAIMNELDSMRPSDAEIACWFRSSLEAALGETATHTKRQATVMAKQKSEIAGKQERLLNAYLAGALDQETFTAKSNELKADAARIAEAIAQLELAKQDGWGTN